MFDLRQKYECEKIDVMQLLVNLLMNGSYGYQIRKDIDENYVCKSEPWISSEYAERVKEYAKIGYEIYIVKLVDGKGLQDDVKKSKTMPFLLRSFCIFKWQKNYEYFYTRY